MEWTTFFWISGVYWGLYLIYIFIQVDSFGEQREVNLGGELPQPA